MDAVDRGLPRKEVVGLFGVSLATLKRWLKRREEGEGLDPKPSPGRTPTILATAEEKRALWEQLEANDEATLERHCELWEEKRGVRVSVATMSWAIRNKLGWTYKKRRPSLRARRGGEKCLARASERGGPEARFVFVDVAKLARPTCAWCRYERGRPGARGLTARRPGTGRRT